MKLIKDMTTEELEEWVARAREIKVPERSMHPYIKELCKRIDVSKQKERAA
jgi:hypothetical protein